MPNSAHRSVLVKIILGIFSFLIILPYPALAVQSEPDRVSGTNIELAKVAFNSGETVSGKLVLENKGSKASSDWIYRASITEDSEAGPGNIINQVYYKDNISIPANKETKLNFSLPILKTLPSGQYGVLVELLTASVANPGPFFYKKIKVNGSGEGFLTTQSLFLVANEKTEPATVGLPHKKDDKLKARITLENKSSQDVKASSEFNIYIRQSHNPSFKSILGGEEVFPKNSSKTLDFDIPALPEGNSYWGELLFSNSSGQIAQIEPFRIVISGTSAKIIKVTTDKENYKRGEEVKLAIEYTGPVEDNPQGNLGQGVLSANIKDSNKELGAGQTSIDLNKAGQASLKMKALADFSSADINVKITQENKVLDEFTSKLKGSLEAKNSNVAYQLPLIIGLVVLLALLAVWLVVKKKKVKPLVVIVILLSTFGVLLADFQVPQTQASHGFISPGNDQTDISDRTSGHGVNPLEHEWNGPSQDSLWRPGERPNFGGRMWQDGCGNTFGAPGYGLPNRIRFRIQTDLGGWNIQGGDIIGTVTDGATARSSVGWFWNGWTVPNNIGQKAVLVQAEPEGYNLQGSPQHYDRLLLSERILIGPAAPGSLSTNGQPGCSNTPYSQINFTWGEVAPQITDGFSVEVSETNNFSGARAVKSVGSCGFCSTNGSGGWANLNGALIADPGTGNLALQPGGRTYFWRVYASNSNPGSGIASATSSFTTVARCSAGGPPPPPPVGGPPPPPGGSIGTPTLTPISGLPCVPASVTYGPAVPFSWTNVSGATSYQIQVSVWPSFVNSGGGGEFASKTVSSTSTTGAGGWVQNGVSPVDTVTKSLKLNSGTTYYWRVRATGAAGTGNWSTTSLFSASVCAKGFTVKILPPNTKTIKAGEIVSYLVQVNAVGGFDGIVTLTPTWQKPVPVNVSFSSLTPNPVSVGSPFPPSATVTLDVSSTTAASIGSFNFTVTGTSPGSPNQSDSGTLIITAAPPGGAPWIQTTKGDVGSIGEIKLTTPCPTSPCAGNLLFADKLVISKSAVPSTLLFRTAKSWLVGGYSGPLNVYPSKYSDFIDKFASNVAAVTPPVGNKLPGGNGLSVISNNVSWNGSFAGSTACNPSKKEARVVFIAGDLTITGNTGVTTCPVVIIVNGDVTVGTGVRIINAMIVANGSFSTQVTSSDLTVNGGVIAALNSGPGSKFNLNRDLGLSNSTNPAEKFVYQPKYLWYLTEYLGVAKNHFTEAKP